MFVADESLGSGVPFQRASQPIRNVAEVTNRDGPATDLYVADRLLSRANATHKVAEVPFPRAVVNVNFIGFDGFVHNVFGFGFQDFTADANGPLGSFEDDAAERVRPVGYFQAVVVDIGQVL